MERSWWHKTGPWLDSNQLSVYHLPYFIFFIVTTTTGPVYYGPKHPRALTTSYVHSYLIHYSQDASWNRWDAFVEAGFRVRRLVQAAVHGSSSEGEPTLACPNWRNPTHPSWSKQLLWLSHPRWYCYIYCTIHAAQNSRILEWSRSVRPWAIFSRKQGADFEFCLFPIFCWSSNMHWENACKVWIQSGDGEAVARVWV